MKGGGGGGIFLNLKPFRKFKHPYKKLNLKK